MTPSRDRLTGITIERFRGVADRLELDLDADAVLIEGPNGTGKTTIADAVAWCLTGQLPELVRRQEGEPRKFDHVVSAYREGERARVTLAFRLDGEEVTLVRTGTGKDPGRLVFSGAEGAAAQRLMSTLETDARTAPSDWLHSVTLLRQDLVARFATAPADKRYTQMRSLLGLGYLDRFEDATRSARTRQARVASEAEAAATDAEARAESRETALQAALAVSRDDPGSAVAIQLNNLAAAAEPVIEVRLPAIATVEFIVQLGRQVGELLVLTEELESHAPPARQVLDELRSEKQRADKELSAAVERLQELSRAAPWERLASAGLQLLTDRCPVCDQAISADETRARLQQILERSSSAASELADAERRVQRARSASVASAAELERSERSMSEFAAIEDDWRRGTADLDLIAVRTSPDDAGAIREFLATARSLRDGLRRLYVDASAPATRADLARLESEARNARGAAAEATAAAVAARTRADELAQLERASADAGVSITRDALHRLNPAFSALFDRLGPHPTFRELDVVHTVAYRKGRTTTIVRDALNDVEINPAVAFSEGQNNALAVALFAALALSVPSPPMPFLFLDDPLQTFDGPNALAFSELCRELRDRRQLIVTTHDRRFSALLARKLGPREEGRTALLLRLEGWRPEGPTFSVEPLDYDVMPRALRAA